MRTWSTARVALLCLVASTTLAGRGDRLMPAQALTEPAVALPNKPGSFKFAVLGDFGTGDKTQYQLAEQMAALHQRFKYEIVVLVGDNLHGPERPQDSRQEFELPYKPPLTPASVLRLARQPRRAQTQLLQTLQHGRQALLHLQPEIEHPVLRRRKHLSQCPSRSSGSRRTQGVHERLEDRLLPPSALLVGRPAWLGSPAARPARAALPECNVSVSSPGTITLRAGEAAEGIASLVVAPAVSSGRKHRQVVGITAKGFDTDLAFMAAEIAGDENAQQHLSRTGELVDSGC